MAGRRLLVVLVLGLGLAGLVATHARPASSASPSPTRGVVIVNTNLALENASAAGTGIVITRSGEVLTNNHVVRGATTIRILVPASGRSYTATVLGYDIVDDVALLKLQGASGLATVRAGNSAKLKIGQATRAVGNANGGGRLVTTTGRVTGLNRTISVRGDTGEVSQLRGLIETSARLVPGDSGGPLLNALGRVIGIDAAGSPTFSVSAQSDGYAIPINRALSLAKQIEAGRSSATVHIGDTAFIGITVSAATGGGVSIGTIVPGSPAESAGLEQGDVLTSLDGNPVTSFARLRTLLFSKHPGDSVTIAYTDPAGNSGSTTIVLASGPPQ